jgi:hypothetical protein
MSGRHNGAAAAAGAAGAAWLDRATGAVVEVIHIEERGRRRRCLVEDLAGRRFHLPLTRLMTGRTAATPGVAARLAAQPA